MSGGMSVGGLLLVEKAALSKKMRKVDLREANSKAA